LADYPINGHALAGPHSDDIARDDGGRIDFDLLTAPDNDRFFGDEVEECSESIGRSPSAAHFHPMPEEHEGDEHRRRFEEDIGATADGDPRAEQVSGRNTCRDEDGHVELAAQQGIVRTLDVDPTPAQNDGRREEEGHPLRANAEGRWRDATNKKVTQVGKQDDRNG